MKKTICVLALGLVMVACGKQLKNDVVQNDSLSIDSSKIDTSETDTIHITIQSDTTVFKN